MTMHAWALTNAGLLLLVAQIMLLWMFTQYALPELYGARRGVTPLSRAALAQLAVRGVLAGVASYWLAEWHASMAILMLVACVAVGWLRSKVRPAYGAEFEVAVNGFFIAAAVWLAWWTDASPHAVGRIPNSKSAAVLIIAAIGLFTVRGGTYVVRGMLDKVGTLPPLNNNNKEARTDAEFALDIKEYNRGRLIGDIERILLVVMVAMHSYEALGFLIAAKGLIRSRELENRSWAEYFLVGTLASTLVAVVAGLAIHFTISVLW